MPVVAQDHEGPPYTSYRQVGEKLEAVRKMVVGGPSRPDERWSGAYPVERFIPHLIEEDSLSY